MKSAANPSRKPPLLAVTAGVALVASLVMAASTPATVDVDGQRIVADVAPVTTPGAAFLPVRAIADATGATTTFDEASRIIVVRRGTNTMRMRLGDRRATFNGRRIRLSHAPFTVRGRTLVPSAAIAEILGSSVRYDARTANVDVRTAGVIVAPVGDDRP